MRSRRGVVRDDDAPVEAPIEGVRSTRDGETRAPGFDEEEERIKLALSLHRVYMLAHTASNRVRALDSLLFFSFTLI